MQPRVSAEPRMEEGDRCRRPLEQEVGTYTSA